MDPFEKAYNKAIKFLSYRPRSEKEVRDKLLKTVISTELSSGEIPRGSFASARDDNLGIIDQVIEKLKEQQFVNDQEFIRWWIEQRMEFKPRSLSLIKRELKQKGIASEIIDSQFSMSNFQFSNDLEQAKKIVQKKIKRYKDLPRQEIYQKLGRYLAGKGFDWDTIKKSIDEILKKGV